MRTKPFVRTLEFLWQEGHTAHVNPEEAENEAFQMIDVYTKFTYEQAAIPVITGRKSKVGTLAGADRTCTIEAMMGDQKASQAGTNHSLGQNFSWAFGTQFMDEIGERQHVWQTSWAIVMTHGEDSGLMLPPKLAPIKVVIVPICRKEDEKTGVLKTASSVKENLQSAGIKVKLDDMDQGTPGWKFNFCEMKERCSWKASKSVGISMEPSILEAYAKDKVDEIQSSLLGRATSFRDSNIVDVGSYDEVKAAISLGKWARGPWSASDVDEQGVKEETGATIRCFPFKQPQGTKTCLMTGGKPAEEVAIFAHIESWPPSDIQMVLFGRGRLPMVGPLVQIMHMRCRQVSWINHDFIILVRVLSTPSLVDSTLPFGESQKFENRVPRSE